VIEAVENYCICQNNDVETDDEGELDAPEHQGSRSMTYPVSDPNLDLVTLLAHLVRRERMFRRSTRHSITRDVEL
jgi:hypothetical protein